MDRPSQRRINRVKNDLQMLGVINGEHLDCLYYVSNKKKKKMHVSGTRSDGVSSCFKNILSYPF